MLQAICMVIFDEPSTASLSVRFSDIFISKHGFSSFHLTRVSGLGSLSSLALDKMFPLKYGLF